MTLFKLTRPCANCPFRKGQGERFRFGRERIEEIVEATAFQCHKTVDYSGDWEGESGDHPQQCAGLMSLLHRERRPNAIMQVGERLKGFDPSRLVHDDVYGSIDEAIAAHRGESMTDKEPWFPCYPSKLLGAFSAMRPDEGYVYWIVCLRIYELGKACPDTLDALARRTGMNKRRVSDALDRLFRSKKLVREADGIMNPFAAEVIKGETALREERSRAGQKGSTARWLKAETNQQTTNGNRIAELPLGHSRAKSHLPSSLLDSDSKVQKEKKKGGAVLAADWRPSTGEVNYGFGLGLSKPAIDNMAEDMRLWAQANANRAVGRKDNWSSAFKGWMRREAAKRGGLNGHKPVAGNAKDTVAAAAARLAGRFGGNRQAPGADGPISSAEGMDDHRRGARRSDAPAFDLDLSPEPRRPI